MGFFPNLRNYFFTETLDGKIVLDVTRKFIEKLTERRNCLTKKNIEQETEEERKEMKSVTFREESASQENLIGPPETYLHTPFPSSAWQLSKSFVTCVTF